MKRKGLHGASNACRVTIAQVDQSNHRHVQKEPRPGIHVLAESICAEIAPLAYTTTRLVKDSAKLAPLITIARLVHCSRPLVLRVQYLGHTLDRLLVVDQPLLQETALLVGTKTKQEYAYTVLQVSFAKREQLHQPNVQ